MLLLPPQQRFHIRPILKTINNSSITACIPRMTLPALTRRPDFRTVLPQGLRSTIREPSHNANITGRLQQRLKIRITVGYEEHVLLPLWWYIAQNLIHKFRLVSPRKQRHIMVQLRTGEDAVRQDLRAECRDARDYLGTVGRFPKHQADP